MQLVSWGYHKGHALMKEGLIGVTSSNVQHSDVVLVPARAAAKLITQAKMMMVHSSGSKLSYRYRCFMVLLVLSLVMLVAMGVGPFQHSCSRATAEVSLRTKCRTATMPIEWFSWLSEVGMQKHGRLMVINHLEESDIVHFDHDLLRSIGVDSAKDRLLILNQKNKHIRRNKGRPAISRMFSKITAEAQSVIIDRVQTLHVDEVKLLLWTKTAWPLCTRKALEDLGYLSLTAPLPGSGSVMTDSDRTSKGIELLNNAKDMLWAALYGSPESNVNIPRVERELLVITIPGRKAFVFNFFQAVTEVGALGTWRDPDERCHDADEPNMMLQVEYGECASEIVGDAIMVSIHIINLLEVNEVVLYARSSNIEQSTLFTELYFEKHEAKASAVIRDLNPDAADELQMLALK